MAIQGLSKRFLSYSADGKTEAQRKETLNPWPLSLDCTPGPQHNTLLEFAHETKGSPHHFTVFKVFPYTQWKAK